MNSYTEIDRILRRSKIDQRNPQDLRKFSSLPMDKDMIKRFENEIRLICSTYNKTNPEEVFRRFALNGDGFLDYNEFKLASKRIGLSNAKAHELFTSLQSIDKKLDIVLFCRIMGYWYSILEASTAEPPEIATNDHSKVISNASPLEKLNIKRALDIAKANICTLKKLFLQLDIQCSGKITVDELELGLKYIGIFLSKNEYNHLHTMFPENTTFKNGINYSKVLTFLGDKADTSIFNSKIWKKMCLLVDKLEILILPTLKTASRYIAPRFFRECLTKCGLPMSNQDFNALNINLMQFCDKEGNINANDILCTLRNHDYAPNSHLPKKKETDRFESASTYNIPAGRSNVQRESKRCFHAKSNENRQTDFVGKLIKRDENQTCRGGISLESKLKTRIKHVGLEIYFPGDKCGRITIGEFRQGLSQLGIIARNSEIESFFSKLDSTGKGHVPTTEFYNFFTKVYENNNPKASKESMDNDLIRSIAAKIVPILAVCKTLDVGRCNCVTKHDFIWVLQENGIWLSNEKYNSVVQKLSRRRDGVISFKELETLQHYGKDPNINDSVAEQDAGSQEVHEVVEPSNSCSFMAQSELQNSGMASNNGELVSTVGHTKSKSSKVEEKKVILDIVGNILENKIQLKKCFQNFLDSGIVSRIDLEDILLSPRLNLGLTATMSRLIVDSVLPQDLSSLGFMQFIHFLVQFYSSKGLNTNTKKSCSNNEHMSGLKVLRFKTDSSTPPSYHDVSICKKLLSTECCLKDLKTTDGCQSAGIILRRAFRTISRDYEVPSENGQYVSALRNKDLRHVCSRVGVDLTQEELDYVIHKLDKKKHGFFLWSDMLAFFMQVM